MVWCLYPFALLFLNTIEDAQTHTTRTTQSFFFLFFVHSCSSSAHTHTHIHISTRIRAQELHSMSLFVWGESGAQEKIQIVHTKKNRTPCCCCGVCVHMCSHTSLSCLLLSTTPHRMSVCCKWCVQHVYAVWFVVGVDLEAVDVVVALSVFTTHVCGGGCVDISPFIIAPLSPLLLILVCNLILCLCAFSALKLDHYEARWIDSVVSE